MGTSTLVDLVKIEVLSSGTGPFQLGVAAAGFRGLEALIDNTTYSYSVQNGSNYEAGTGVYLADTGVLVRTPNISSAGNAAVAFPASIEVSFVALAEDFGSGSFFFELLNALGNSQNAAITQYAVTQALLSIVMGNTPFSLPDEANGDPIPAAGSGLPYLSAKVLKIA